MALESGGDSSSVALIRAKDQAEPVLRYSVTDSGQSHSSALLPLARALLAEQGLTWRELDGLAVGVGPGSFTGLRIACGLAQGLALGAGLPVLPVHGFELHAYIHAEQHRAEGIQPNQQFEIAFDARLGERFVAAVMLEHHDETIQCRWVREPEVMAQERWHQMPKDQAIVLNDPVAADLPLAAWMARWAMDPRCAQSHQWVAARQLVPLYVREKVAQTIAERQSTPDLVWSPMTARDLASVMVIERQAYPFPWSSGNFQDSMAAGYEMWVLKERGVMIGYLVWMAVVDEAHLLNLALSPARHGRGLGNAMMKYFLDQAKARGMTKVLLEVRPSNRSAIALYQRFGFAQMGLRKDYYPNSVGELGKPSEPQVAKREDAMVMQLPLGAPSITPVSTHLSASADRQGSHA